MSVDIQLIKSCLVERVTRAFYDGSKSQVGLKNQHKKFLSQIQNITDEADRKWYTSIMLNRLMFVYFIQCKGLLDYTDPNSFNGKERYLQEHLEAIQQKNDCPFAYYRDFLLPLFQCFNQCERTRKQRQLFGNIPYLNGGIFEVHLLEQKYPDIQISNTAFKDLFAFFTKFTWYLDDRPSRNDKEINPDVLGYILEKYINQQEKGQKEMGAYYTKEDITGYISKNTIIPALFEKVARQHKAAFAPAGLIWSLLQQQPDRYIYEAMAHGVLTELPAHIAAGITDLAQREEWNQLAEEQYALQTETWREVVARRQRYEEVHRLLADGQISTINDLITYNLDIMQFVVDVITSCSDASLICSFYDAITHITILDPTCGSGAFLFAALNILRPLYQACLTRMNDLVKLHESHQIQLVDEHLKIFQDELRRVGSHHRQQYLILKSIIVNNLYGVDIMEEAIEICRLRFFLNLVAQLDSPKDLEPLPDIDFNVLAGNTLIGFTCLDEVRQVTQKLVNMGNTEETLASIEQRAREIERDERLFRNLQTSLDAQSASTSLSTYKQRLRANLKNLRDELDSYLATEYGIDRDNIPDQEVYSQEYAQWHKTNKPFHWWIEFYKIMQAGGFDVIIGNPPYLELREVNYAPRNYQTRASSAIHAMCIERSLQVLLRRGCISMIVPLALVSTRRMKTIQELLEARYDVWYANYSWRPGKLFDTVNRALTIFIGISSKQQKTFSTTYQKWTATSRNVLMEKISYTRVPRARTAFWVPKIENTIEASFVKKCLSIKTPLSYFMANTVWRVYYRVGGGLYWKVFTNFPPAFKVNDQSGHSTRETWFTLANKEMVPAVIAALSSSTFWMWYTITSNCRDLNPYDINNFPVPASSIKDASLIDLGQQYLQDIQQNSTMMVRIQKQTGRTETQSFKLQKSKPIIDEIDRVLAQHYGFTPVELDYIINYDIKYRMGCDSDDKPVEVRSL